MADEKGISLFIVLQHKKGDKHEGLRLADLDADNKWTKYNNKKGFSLEDLKSPKKYYLTESKDMVDQFGVWEWKFGSDKRNISTTLHNEYLIEIIFVPGTNSVFDVINVIKHNGIEKPNFSKFMLCSENNNCLSDNKDILICLFCEIDNFISNNMDKYIFCNGADEPPLYYVSKKRCLLKIEVSNNSIYFLSSHKLNSSGISKETKPLRAVKTIMDSISNKKPEQPDAVKTKQNISELTKNEHQMNDSGTASMQTSIIRRSVSNVDNVDQNKANDDKNEPNTVHDELINKRNELNQINNNLETARHDYNECMERLNTINDEIKRKEDELSQKEVECDSLNKKHLQLLNECDSLNIKKIELLKNNELIKCEQMNLKQDVEQHNAEKKRIETEFEQKIVERIDWAKNDVSEFMADLTFRSLFDTISSKLVRPDQQRVSDGCLLHEFKVFPDCQQIKKIEDIYESLVNNFDIVGISSHIIKISSNILELLSIWLFASFRTKIPLLLAGPNAQLIVDALSISLFARRASIFYCEGEPSRDAIQRIKTAKGKIIAIHHICQSKWVDYLPEILSIPNKYFFVIHPYIEDLRIEPKSLYSYILPLFTDLLINPSSDETIYDKLLPGKLIDESLTNTSMRQIDKEYRRKLVKIHNAYREKLIEQKLMNNYVIDKIWGLYKEFYNLANDIHVKFENDNNGDDELNLCFLLLCYLPYAYVTGQIEKLKERLEVSETITLSKECKDILNYYLGN